MKQNFIIIDDFYSDPLSCYSTLLDSNNQIDIYKDAKDHDCSYEITPKLSYLLGEPISLDHSFFVVGDANHHQMDELNPDANIITANTSYEWIAIVYLQLPFVSCNKFGLKLYSHIKSGMENYNPEIKFDVNNKSEWKEYASIPTRYNRMVLFRGDLWHSYGEGYGDQTNNSLIYQKYLINLVNSKTPSSSYYAS